jgi:hypothetical protein
MKIIKSEIKVEEIPISVTSVITTVDQTIFIKSESATPDTPKFNMDFLIKHDPIVEPSADSYTRRSSFIEAFYSNRQDSFDTILELQKKIIALKLELEIEKRKYKLCCC